MGAETSTPATDEHSDDGVYVPDVEGGVEFETDMPFLPPEIWVMICDKLGVVDLVRLGGTCRYLRAISSDDCFWRYLYLLQFPKTRFVDTAAAVRCQLQSGPYLAEQLLLLRGVGEDTSAMGVFGYMAGGGLPTFPCDWLGRITWTPVVEANLWRNLADPFTYTTSPDTAAAAHACLNTPLTRTTVIERTRGSAIDSHSFLVLAEGSVLTPFPASVPDTELSRAGGLVEHAGYDLRPEQANAFAVVPVGMWRVAYFDRINMNVQSREQERAIRN